MGRIFFSLFAALVLSLFVLAGQKNTVYAGVCRDLGIGGSYYCSTIYDRDNDIYILHCPSVYDDNYDPDMGHTCCQAITGSSCERDPALETQYRYQAPVCADGTTPTGNVIYLPGSNFSCTFRGTCGQWFPSKTAACDLGEDRDDCILGQLCCAPSQAVECGDIVSTNDILPTDTRYDGYYNCPEPGQVRVAVYRTDEGPVIYCRKTCRCVTPCGVRPGTTKTCNSVSLGTYVKNTNDPSDKSCNTPHDVTDDDDRWISTVQDQCWQEWKRTCEEHDGEEYCRWGWVQICSYRKTCEKMATVCTCEWTPTSTPTPTLTPTPFLPFLRPLQIHPVYAIFSVKENG